MPWKALAVVLVLLGIAALIAWRALRPLPVVVVQPQWRSVTETVAASGQVAGRRESSVGSPVPGTVAQVFVQEGDVVTHGQPLARVQNNVARAQVAQAEQALRTAQAELKQAEAGARPSELQAARAQVQQAQATVDQRQAQVAQARAELAQAEARRTLARQTLARNEYLLGQGAIARQAVDQARADDRAAAAEVNSAQSAVKTAQANLSAAQAGVAAAQAQLRTLQAGPRPEAVAVARQQVRGAQAALQVAREQAQSAVIRAPFAGTVTQILLQPGAPVGTNGIVRLVEGGRPEIVMDVDESNLADLRAGQPAVITSATYRTVRLSGRVTEIGAQVDPTRGTVQVKVVPDQSAAWLRPGETVNVNIVVAQNVRRLMIPSTAVRRQGDQTIALVVRNGHAVAQPVVLGAVQGELVPVLSGLTPEDRVVRDAGPVTPGARVSART